MKACIVICTYRRFDLLPKAIESALGQRDLPSGFATVVVDNSGQPHLSIDVASRYTGVERFQYIIEPLPGLSRARNIGWRSTDADIVAYIDDDAIAEPDWLSSLVNAFVEAGENAAVVGGLVRAIWPGTKPDWLHLSLESYLSIVNWGGARREVSKGEWLAGTNISFKRAYLQSSGGFEETLGRKEALLLSNEELAVTSVIMASGGKIIYEPAAIVNHLISPNRLSHDWFRQRVFWQAISDLIASSSSVPTAGELWDGVENYFGHLPPSYRTPIGFFVNPTGGDLFRDELGAIYKLATMLGHGLPSPGFGVVVVATGDICNLQSAAGNHLADVVEYLSERSRVYVCIPEPLSTADLERFDGIELPAQKIIISQAESNQFESLIALESFPALFAKFPICAVWISAPENKIFSELDTFDGAIFIDMALVKSISNSSYPLARPERCYVAHSAGTIHEAGFWQNIDAHNQFAMPFFRHIRAELDASWQDAANAGGLVILCDETEANVLLHLAGEPDLQHIFDDAIIIASNVALHQFHSGGLLPLKSLAEDLGKIGARPIACLDLCELNAEYAFVREIMLRFDVPILPIATLREKAPLRLPRHPTLPLSGEGYAEAIRACLTTTSLRFQNDAGWRALGKLMQLPGKFSPDIVHRAGALRQRM